MTNDDHHDLSQQVRDGVDRTLQAGTARIRQTMITGPEAPIVATGSVDFERRRATAVLALPPSPEQPDGVVHVTMVIDGRDVYTEVVDRPGRWITERLSDDATPLSTGDPGLLLDWLRGTTDATAVAQEVVDGESRTVIDAIVAVDRAVERAPDDASRALRAVIDGMVPDGASTPIRVVLDPSGRVRRLEVVLQAADDQPVLQLGVELDDLGAAVAIEIPPADALLSAEEVAVLRAEVSERFGVDLEIPDGA